MAIPEPTSQRDNGLTTDMWALRNRRNLQKMRTMMVTQMDEINQSLTKLVYDGILDPILIEDLHQAVDAMLSELSLIQSMHETRMASAWVAQKTIDLSKRFLDVYTKMKELVERLNQPLPPPEPPPPLTFRQRIAAWFTKLHLGK